MRRLAIFPIGKLSLVCFHMLHCLLGSLRTPHPKVLLVSCPLHLIVWSLFPQVAPLSNADCPSKTSLLDRGTLKATSCKSDWCFALRRSARHLIFANAIVFHVQILVLQFKSTAPNMDNQFIVHSYTKQRLQPRAWYFQGRGGDDNERKGSHYKGHSQWERSGCEGCQKLGDSDSIDGPNVQSLLVLYM